MALFLSGDKLQQLHMLREGRDHGKEKRWQPKAPSPKRELFRAEGKGRRLDCKEKEHDCPFACGTQLPAYDVSKVRTGPPP